jgi:hypothetical protein
MGLDQPLEMAELMGNQWERTLGALMTHETPPCERDLHYFEPFSLYNRLSRLVYSWGMLPALLSFVIPDPPIYPTSVICSLL